MGGCQVSLISNEGDRCAPLCLGVSWFMPVVQCSHQLRSLCTLQAILVCMKNEWYTPSRQWCAGVAQHGLSRPDDYVFPVRSHRQLEISHRQSSYTTAMSKHCFRPENWLLTLVSTPLTLLSWSTTTLHTCLDKLPGSQ